MNTSILWNGQEYASLEDAKAAHKALLAARPKCEYCNKRAGTQRRYDNGALICGRCLSAARKAMESRGTLANIANWMG